MDNFQFPRCVGSPCALSVYPEYNCLIMNPLLAAFFFLNQCG
jgi:hypothetical protein